MAAAMMAGCFYFVIVFAAGTVLGVARTLLLAPQIGALGAVLAELPVMLMISWIACRHAMRRLAPPLTAPKRIAIGATAFGLLMIAETVLTVVLGGSLDDVLQSWRTPAGAAGLAGQAMFGLMPLAIRRSR